MAIVPASLRVSNLTPTRALWIGIVFGLTLTASIDACARFVHQRRQRGKRRRLQRGPKRPRAGQITVERDEIVRGVEGLIGNTPLIRINSLSNLVSNLTGLKVEIVGKCEFMNPFGSVKDRVSREIVRHAEQNGLVEPNSGSTLFEGTSGSTGISIAGIAKARGYNAHIVLPDDVAEEKIRMLEVLGARVEKVRPVSIVDKKHYVNLARLRALEFGSEPSSSPSNASEFVVTEPSESRTKRRGLFADQFENLSNFRAHHEETGPEIHRQTRGFVDAFVSGAGTGGTIAGVGTSLKRLTDGRCEVVLSDCEGSGLYYWVKEGVMWNEREREGTRRRFQVDTITEGIGLNRVTSNLNVAKDIIDDAFRVTDVEALSMSRHLAEQDGLFLGSSSAVNLVACVRLALKWIREGKTLQDDENASDFDDCSDDEEESEEEDGVPARTRVRTREKRPLRIATILCDSGNRHTSKFWNEGYLERNGISYPRNLDWLLSEHQSSTPSPPSSAIPGATRA